MSNILELSGFLSALEDLLIFSVPGDTENIAWFWFTRAGISAQADTMPSEINDDLSLVPSTLYLQCSGPTS